MFCWNYTFSSPLVLVATSIVMGSAVDVTISTAYAHKSTGMGLLTLQVISPTVFISKFRCG